MNDIDRAYKENPTIENYLKLRKKYPNHDIEVALLGGIETIFAVEEETKKYGIDGDLLAGVMDADIECIDRMSIIILRELAKRKNLERKGEVHLIGRGKVMPAALIDFLIKVALDAISWNGTLEIPRSLIVLIRERLGGKSCKYAEIENIKERKNAAIFIAARHYLRTGEIISYRRLSKIMGIQASTISRWFPDKNFEENVKRKASMMEFFSRRRSGELDPEYKAHVGWAVEMTAAYFLRKGILPTEKLIIKALGISKDIIRQAIWSEVDYLEMAKAQLASLPKDQSLYEFLREQRKVLHQK